MLLRRCGRRRFMPPARIELAHAVSEGAGEFEANRMVEPNLAPRGDRTTGLDPGSIRPRPRGRVVRQPDSRPPKNGQRHRVCGWRGSRLRGAWLWLIATMNPCESGFAGDPYADLPLAWLGGGRARRRALRPVCRLHRADPEPRLDRRRERGVVPRARDGTAAGDGACLAQNDVGPTPRTAPRASTTSSPCNAAVMRV
jgi:hypothetical protein